MKLKSSQKKLNPVIALGIGTALLFAQSVLAIGKPFKNFTS
jgi:S1-C subfamily serine protease